MRTAAVAAAGVRRPRSTWGEHHLVPGVGVDEGVDHLSRLHEDVGHVDHQRLAEPLRVVVLHEAAGESENEFCVVPKERKLLCGFTYIY